MKSKNFFSSMSNKIMLQIILLVVIICTLISYVSFSRTKEDIIKNNDERDKYILLKTSYKSLEILRSINFIVIMLSMILFAVTKSEFVLGIFVVSSIYMTLNFLVELAVNIYYEKNE